MRAYRSLIYSLLVFSLTACETAPEEARPYCGDKKCNGTETIATCKEDCTCDNTIKQFCDTFGGRLSDRVLEDLAKYCPGIPRVLGDGNCLLCSEGGGFPFTGPIRCEPPPPCKSNADCKAPYPICFQGLCLECSGHGHCPSGNPMCILTQNLEGKVIDGMCGCTSNTDCREEEFMKCVNNRCVKEPLPMD